MVFKNLLLLTSNLLLQFTAIYSILFLKYRVSDQTSKASAIGATYNFSVFDGCDTQGMKK